MRKIVILVFIICHSYVSAQNLVPNPNFQDYSTCPVNISEMPALNWSSPAGGSSDYFNECAINTPAYIPNNFFGLQYANSGAAYAGVITYYPDNLNYREYIQAELTSPTELGCYELTLIYNKPENTFESDGLAIHLSNGIPGGYFNLTPQLEVTEFLPNVETDWIVKKATFFSEGGETHITIGNFRTSANTTYIGEYAYGDFAYYYIDSVSVEYLGQEPSNIDVELGEDIYICEDDFPLTLTSNYPNLTNIWSTGETGSSIQVNEPGKYILRANENCEYDIDSVEVFIIQEPEFILEDESICEGSELTVNLDGSLGTYQWEDGSNSTSYQITENGTYAVSLMYDCGEIVEEFDVEVLPMITIPEIDDITVCSSDLPLIVDLLEFDTGVNTFEWSTQSNEALVFISASGQYSVEVYNNCFSDNESFNVLVQDDLPGEILHTDTLLCAGEHVFINTGLFEADLTWQDGSSDVSYVVDEPGLYTLIATNACGTNSYEFIISSEEELPFDIGNDISLCPGDSVLIFAPDDREVTWNSTIVGDSLWIKEEGALIAEVMGFCDVLKDTLLVEFNGVGPLIDLPDSLLLCAGDTVVISAGSNTMGIDYTWNTGSTESFTEITTSGIYSVVGINNCGMDEDSIVVTLGEALPGIELLSSYTICPGDSLQLAVFPADNAVLWSTGLQDSTITLTTPGTYSVSISNSCGTNAFDFDLQTLGLLSPFDLGENVSICQQDSIELEGPITSGNYMWNTEENSSTIVAYIAGVYTLEISGVCNTVIDSIVVQDLGSVPTVDLGDDVSLCEGDVVELFAMGEGIDTYTWSTGANTESIMVEDTGTVIVLVENICGISFDTIQISYNDEAPEIDLGADLTICEGDSILLNVGNVAGEIQWNTGSDLPSIYVNESGLYIASLTSSCGNSIDSIFVDYEGSADPIDIGEDQIICEGDSILLEVENYATGIVWSTGSQEDRIHVKEAGLYYVSVTTTCELIIDSLALEIEMSPNEIDLGKDTILCPGDEILIILDTEEDEQVLWHDMSTLSTRTLTEEGLYIVELYNTCGLVRDSIELQFEKLVEPFEFEDIETLCEGDSIELDGSQENAVYYFWQDGSEDSRYTITEAGIYTLEVGDACGSQSASIEVEYVIESPFISELESSYTVCDDELLEIDLEEENAVSIVWNDGVEVFDRTISQAGFYSYELEGLCIDTLFSFEVIQESCVGDDVYFPNVFSPNDDGVNDIFRMYYPIDWLSPKVEIRIYNRWGEEIFYSQDPKFEWMGNYKGQNLNPGVYVYSVQVEVLVEGAIRRFDFQGDITIWR